jgi:hypothetical protein
LGYTDSKPSFNQVGIFLKSIAKRGPPNTILESMSMEPSVVGAQVGGVGDPLKNRYTGFIIPSKTLGKIYEMGKLLFHNPKKIID